jgi:hypothetical protein
LDVADQTEVLEHLDRCRACRDLFGAEASIRNRLRAALGDERCPAAFGARLRAELGKAGRRYTLFRMLPVVGLAAAAALVAAFLPGPALDPSPETDAPRRLRFASRTTAPSDHPAAVHGPLLACVEAAYDSLLLDQVRPEEPFNANHVFALRALGRPVFAASEFGAACAAAGVAEPKLPAAFVDGGTILGGVLPRCGGSTVPGVVVGFPDREVVVFELPAETPPPAMLHDDSAAAPAGVVFSSCPMCDVLWVRSAARTCLVVSRQFRDWERPWIYARARTL